MECGSEQSRTRQDRAGRAPSETVLKDGHYAGTTAQDEPISFDVVMDGKALTNLSFMIKASSSLGGHASIVDEPITIAGFLPVGRDGHFGDTVTGDGIRAVIEGTFAPAVTATGTLHVDLVVVHSGSDVECSSGEVSWQTRLV
jgi:hypothetical protein